MAATSPAAKTPANYGPPFQPRKRLAIGLLIGFLIWSAALWVLYLTTVYPQTHSGHRTGSAEQDHLKTVPR